jgi:hypothetical protein
VARIRWFPETMMAARIGVRQTAALAVVRMDSPDGFSSGG